MREKALIGHIVTHKSSALGIAIAILCGFGASFINLGLAFGSPLTDAARSVGSGELNASNVVWMPLMLAGSIPNLMYCLRLLRKNRTGHKFADGHLSHWVLAFVMAVLWLGSTLLYGVAAAKLGSWGPVLGWPLFMSLIVIIASLLGMMTGEWKNSGRLPIRIQWSGVALLALAVFILASTSRYFS
jgi:L-rhamnose-H+ transport protein